MLSVEKDLPDRLLQNTKLEQKTYFIISRLTGFALTAQSLKDGSAISLKQADLNNKLQQWTFTKEDTFVIDTKELFSLSLLPVVSTPVLKSSEKQKWKVTLDGFLQHQKSILYLGIQKESVKEDASIIAKKLTSKLSQMWMFITVEEMSKKFIENKINQIKFYKGGVSLRIEIMNQSKKMLCQPRLYLDNSKYDELPYFIKGIEEKEYAYHTEEVVVYSTESFSGFLAYSVFDEGVNDNQLIIAFQVKDKKCSFHLEIMREKELPQDKQLLQDSLSKTSPFACIKDYKSFGKGFNGKKSFLFIEFSDNDGTLYKVPTLHSPRGMRKSQNEFRTKSQEFFQKIATNMGIGVSKIDNSEFAEDLEFGLTNSNSKRMSKK